MEGTVMAGGLSIALGAQLPAGIISTSLIAGGFSAVLGAGVGYLAGNLIYDLLNPTVPTIYGTYEMLPYKLRLPKQF